MSGISLPRNLIHLPKTRQSLNYTCGVASLQSIFQHYGDEWREDRLAVELKADPEQGTDHLTIIEFAKKQGYNAHVEYDMSFEALLKHVDAGHPVMVAVQAWADLEENETDYKWADRWDDGHYVVVIGYDDANVFVMDPSTLGNFAYVPRDEFVERWHDIDQRSTKVIHLGLVIFKNEVKYNPNVALPML